VIISPSTRSIEIRESDIINGFIEYELWLSAAPVGGTVVRVQIAKIIHERAKCVEYEDGFNLLEDEVVFSPSNYSVHHTLAIAVDRSQAPYQGTARALLVHDVKSEDLNWASTTKRSLSVTVEEDSPCTDGSQKIDDSFNGIRKCECKQGQFVVATDPSYCNSAVWCRECPDGMVCDRGQFLEQAQLEKVLPPTTCPSTFELPRLSHHLHSTPHPTLLSLLLTTFKPPLLSTSDFTAPHPIFSAHKPPTCDPPPCSFTPLHLSFNSNLIHTRENTACPTLHWLFWAVPFLRLLPSPVSSRHF
jgi:hypothetical protein